MDTYKCEGKMDKTEKCLELKIDLRDPKVNNSWDPKELPEDLDDKTVIIVRLAGKKDFYIHVTDRRGVIIDPTI